MGGIHPTIMCEQVLEHWLVDIIVLGEGEETIKELMICPEGKRALEDVHGIAYKHQGKTFKTPPRQLIHNMDNIPFPAYKYFDFADDIFTVNKNRVIDLCKEIIDRKLDIVWDCETRVNFIWEDMLEWMIKSGCYCISFGVESASETVLKAIKKKTTPEQIEHSIKLTKQMGMKTKMLLMVGNPGEDDRTVRDTTRMIETVRPDFVSVSEAMVFPGTELYELAKQKGLVTDDYWLTDRPAPYFTIENNLEKLLEWSNMIMSANAGIIGKTLRRLRNILERSTGLRVTGEGIEYRKNGVVKRLVTWT